MKNLYNLKPLKNNNNKITLKYNEKKTKIKSRLK